MAEPFAPKPIMEAAAKATQGRHEARYLPGTPTACCDFGVLALDAGRETCRVWTREDVEFYAAANPAAILAWGAQHAADRTRIAKLRAALRWCDALLRVQVRGTAAEERVTSITAWGEERTAESINAGTHAALGDVP